MGEDEEKKRLERQEDENLLFCPSFNSYTSHRFAKIAEEVRAEEASNELENDDDDFEFGSLRSGNGNEIYYGGQFRPNYPIFDRALLKNDDQNRGDSISDSRPVRRNQLKNLFSEENAERESPSCSSSESDDLEGVPSETYCVWRPKSVEESSPSGCKKSSSTGSGSKRWRFLDLLRRSNSDGKDALVLFAPKNNKGDKNERVENSVKVAGNVNAKGISGGERLSSMSSPHEVVVYARNRALKEGEKKKQFVPYRQEFGRSFDSVNGLNKSFPRY